jgi:hypothetical protein
MVIELKYYVEDGCIEEKLKNTGGNCVVNC